jgi:hypothetical protein
LLSLQQPLPPSPATPPLFCERNDDDALFTSKNNNNNNSKYNFMTKHDLHQLAALCIEFVPVDFWRPWYDKHGFCPCNSLTKNNRVSGMTNSSIIIVTLHHLEPARQQVGVSALPDATLASLPPKTNWDDIAGIKSVLRQVQKWPRTKAQQFVVLRLIPPWEHIVVRITRSLPTRRWLMLLLVRSVLHFCLSIVHKFMTRRM